MSYSVKYTDKVKHVLRQLDIELQEVVLDEVDRLALAADVLPVRSLPVSQMRDLYRERGGRAHYLFFNREVVVVRVGHFSRDLSA